MGTSGALEHREDRARRLNCLVKFVLGN